MNQAGRWGPLRNELHIFAYGRESEAVEACARLAEALQIEDRGCGAHASPGHIQGQEYLAMQKITPFLCQALLTMKKPDLAALKKACDGT